MKPRNHSTALQQPPLRSDVGAQSFRGKLQHTGHGMLHRHMHGSEASRVHSEDMANAAVHTSPLSRRFDPPSDCGHEHHKPCTAVHYRVWVGAAIQCECA